MSSFNSIQDLIFILFPEAKFYLTLYVLNLCKNGNPFSYEIELPPAPKNKKPTVDVPTKFDAFFYRDRGLKEPTVKLNCISEEFVQPLEELVQPLEEMGIDPYKLWILCEGMDYQSVLANIKHTSGEKSVTDFMTIYFKKVLVSQRGSLSEKYARDVMKTRFEYEKVPIYSETNIGESSPFILWPDDEKSDIRYYFINKDEEIQYHRMNVTLGCDVVVMNETMYYGEKLKEFGNAEFGKSFKSSREVLKTRFESEKVPVFPKTDIATSCPFILWPNDKSEIRYYFINNEERIQYQIIKLTAEAGIFVMGNVTYQEKDLKRFSTHKFGKSLSLEHSIYAAPQLVPKASQPILSPVQLAVDTVTFTSPEEKMTGLNQLFAEMLGVAEHFPKSIEGKQTLRDFIKGGGKLKTEELVKGVFISYIFGMFNAGLDNIAVEKGKVLFGDHLHCMPSTFGEHYYNGQFVLPYLPNLLLLEGCDEKLTLRDKSALSTFVAEMKLNFFDKKVDTFLGKENLPDWFKRKEAFIAFNERMTRLKRDVDKPDNSFVSLEDLIFSIAPNSKFYFMLYVLNMCQDGDYLSFKIKLQPTSKIENPVDISMREVVTGSGYTLDELVKSLDLFEIDPAKLRKLCEETDIRSVINKLETTLGKNNAKSFMERYLEAHLGNSDDANVKKIRLDLIKENLRKIGLPIFPSLEFCYESSFPFLVWPVDESELITYYYKDEAGYIRNQILDFPLPNTFIMHGIFYRDEELKQLADPEFGKTLSAKGSIYGTKKLKTTTRQIVLGGGLPRKTLEN